MSRSQVNSSCRLFFICKDLLSEVLRLLGLMTCAQASLAAEVLFLRKQLAFYQERKIKARRFDDSARLSMLLLAKLFDWSQDCPGPQSLPRAPWRETPPGNSDSLTRIPPSFGSFATGATSAHHFVTPTSWLFAPIAQRMDVALGASDTIRCIVRGCVRPMPPDSIGSHAASQFASAAVRPAPHCPVLARPRNLGIDSHCAVVFDCASKTVLWGRNISGG